jgi:choice-of-anchor B domain-containing protein
MLKSLLATLLVMFSLSGICQTQPCIGGMAGGYPCHGVDLLAFMANNDIGGGNSNDVWGWTSPVTGREYVLLGKSVGTSFIDISDPEIPRYLGILPTHTTNSTWRDIKTYEDYAYIGSEAGGHGMQIFDLKILDTVTVMPQIFVNSAHYAGFGDSHNIVINPDYPLAYGVGTNTASGGLHAVDISDPLNPVIAGVFEDDGYTHDAQVVTYAGPDVTHTGKQIAFCFNANYLTIVDANDPSDMVMLSTETYVNEGYTHQGWCTPDHKYLLMNDEGDENSQGFNTRTIIWDVQDLENPVVIGEYFHSTAAIDHNCYIEGQFAFQSNYRAGLRILSTQDIANANLTTDAFFDVVPADDNAGFSGSWSNYPYFLSGVIAVTSTGDGLFLVKPTDLEGCTDPASENSSLHATIDDGSCTLIVGCPGDFNSDGFIDTADMLLFLTDFGCASECFGDLDGDDQTNTADLLLFLTAFGFPCP